MKKILFTLVELLIVIAIIAILASMLLPALKKARERSKDILCVSNQKQVMLSLINYSTDYNGNIPLWYRTSDGKTWYSIMVDHGYVPASSWTAGDDTLLTCPSVYPFGKVPKAPEPTGGFTYGLNDGALFHKDYSTTRHINLLKISPVRRAPLIADTIYKPAPDPIWQWYHWNNGSATQKMVSCPHSNKANAAFADGSVETIGEDFFSTFTTFYHYVNGVIRN